MKLLNLEFQAFLSYKDKQEIDFKNFSNSLFLIDGDTGAGKTTIFDAIVFALYGEASDKERDTNFKSHYAKDDTLCYVKLTFLEDGKVVEIYREPAQMTLSKRRDKDGNYPLIHKEPSCVLTLDGKSYTKINECNKKIIDIIKLDKDQFRNTIMIGQNKFADLIRSTTKDRRALFQSILNTYKFEDFKNALSKKYTEESKKIAESNTRIDTILKNYQTEDEELKEKLAIDRPSLNDFDTLSNLISNDISCLEVKYQENVEEKDRLNTLSIKLNNELTKGLNDNAHIASYNEHKKKYEEKLAQKESYDSYKVVIDTYKDSIPSYNKYNGYLEKNKDFLDKKNLLNQNVKELNDLAPDLKQAESLKSEKLSLEESNNTLRDKLKDLSKLKEDFKRLNQELENKGLLERSINTLNASIEEKKNLVENYNKDLSKLTKYNEENRLVNVSIEKLNNEIDTNKKTISTINEYLNKYNSYLSIISNLDNKEILNQTKKNNLRIEEIKLNESIESINKYILDNKDIDVKKLRIENNIKEVNNKFNTLKDIELKYNASKKDKNEIEQELISINILSNDVDNKKNLYNHKELEYKANIVGLIAKDLTDGVACPVCGSVHHTKLAKQTSKVSEDLVKALLDEYTSLNDKLAKLKGTNDEHVKNYSKSLTDIANELSKLGINQVNNANISESINSYKDVLSKSLKELEVSLKEINDTSKVVKVKTEELELKTNDLEQVKKNISSIDLDLVESSSLRKSNLDNIDKLIKDISLYINDINKDNILIKSNNYIIELNTKVNEITSNKDSLIKISNTIKENEDNIKILNVKLEEINYKINELNINLTTRKTNLDTTKLNIKALNESLKGLNILDIDKDINTTNNTINLNLESIKKYDLFILTTNNIKVKLDTNIESLNKDIKKLESLCVTLEKEYKSLVNLTILKDINKIVEYVNTYKDRIEIIETEYDNYNQALTVSKSLVDEDLKNSYDKLVVKDLEELKVNISINDVKFKEIDNIVIDLNSRLTNNKSIYSRYIDTYKTIATLASSVSDLKKLNDVASGQVSGKEKIDFETYYQSQVFNNILAQANKKLNIMTDNVYSMIRHESSDDKASTALDIDIFDTNTGKIRSANSLSGGEIFMASLSLALGFSEISKTNSGAHELDCMFIDEGFGTLDEATLSTVMRVLNQLSNEANRTIGIISHVSELREVIHKQIHVTKDRVTGSKMEIIL